MNEQSERASLPDRVNAAARAISQHRYPLHSWDELPDHHRALFLEYAAIGLAAADAYEAAASEELEPGERRTLTPEELERGVTIIGPAGGGGRDVPTSATENPTPKVWIVRVAGVAEVVTDRQKRLLDAVNDGQMEFDEARDVRALGDEDTLMWFFTSAYEDEMLAEALKVVDGPADEE